MLVNLSIPSIATPFTNPIKQVGQPLVGYEMGALQLQNPAGGLMQQLWTLIYSGGGFYVSAPNQNGWTLLFNDGEATECDLAFDQNMFPFVCYMAAGHMRYFWYDPVSQQFEQVDLGVGYRSPRCTLDDKRPFDVSNSDINFSYINLQTLNLCYRLQRERYQTEHVLGPVTTTVYLDAVNFNVGDRLQWAIAELVPQIELIPLGISNSNITSFISGGST